MFSSITLISPGHISSARRCWLWLCISRPHSRSLHFRCGRLHGLRSQWRYGIATKIGRKSAQRRRCRRNWKSGVLPGQWLRPNLCPRGQHCSPTKGGRDAHLTAGRRLALLSGARGLSGWSTNRKFRRCRMGDLCLALKAESILIERMAGKSTVGIQVPNREREIIWLRENIESSEFIGTKSKLTLALGKDINGRIVTAELAGMPHLLIAGSTGTGKSVAINAMIMSILYKATPDQVRLVLVDPKRLELGNYEGVPHLYTPIITEPKLAANALRNAVREMERRLKLLAAKGVRNIDSYNRLFDDTPSLFGEDANSDEGPLPKIVIIIDELADLMMLDGNNVEESITRLAQMARAVGIHLVLATQRPSVDVITGLIKANFPARVSFRVATKVDSRTLLDANGAESLLGRD